MSALTAESETKKELVYPFKKFWSPEPGELYEVAEGVFWLRMPLPIALDHINLWLLRDGDDWTIVDTGYDAESCKAVWHAVFEQVINPTRVTRIVVTHFHPDHIGLAAWLSQRCDCRIYITQGELGLYRKIHSRQQSRVRDMVHAYLQELGFDATATDTYVPFFLSDPKPVNERVQPSQCEILQEHDELQINGQVWRVICGNGHSPEHACLYNADQNLLIAGDQAIPRISSNVSVYPANRHADPLGDWISSCEKLRDTVPAETVILPSHQEPFIGIQTRMQQLINDHLSQLNQLRLAVQAPISAVQARNILFARKLNVVDTLLATGETLAHLNYLLHRREIAAKTGADGVMLYYQRR
ncbi:zinc metallohydrolase glyoxalase II family protein [Arenicella chitinivorans]|uniref:Zinc metallohydrolase glyoxalase II family protein n=1 Tax=Arenicella chitinivorans TaxID=1329800 RepID=A0A918VPZ9_9GAMM|nr:MBL fold metallo-hydrolase [Arenicella chitinivorans]GHA14517.1 zinc metallohydrolase glyoxalase II family protein [Arenicella chitinivorans]